MSVLNIDTLNYITVVSEAEVIFVQTRDRSVYFQRNISLMVELEKNIRSPMSVKDSSSGDHECLHKIHIISSIL